MKVMPYQFNFDLTRMSRAFFKELTKAAHNVRLHKRIGRMTQSLVKRFRINEITGLNVSEALILIEDLIDIQMKNLVYREQFLMAKRKVLFLPHCSRKYMDSRCKARFYPEIPSYRCSHCSQDCIIHQATLLGEERGYTVYVLPGGSCIHRIMQGNHYDALVGVACGEELKLGNQLLEKIGLPGQAVPLIKNGCSNTRFNIETLKGIL